MIASLTLGSATVTLFNVGDIRADLAEWFGVRADDWPPYRDILAQPIAVPMNAVHIALGDASVLVDAPRWHPSLGEDFIIPGYVPPPSLDQQLRADVERHMGRRLGQPHQPGAVCDGRHG